MIRKSICREETKGSYTDPSPPPVICGVHFFPWHLPWVLLSLTNHSSEIIQISCTTWIPLICNQPAKAHEDCIPDSPPAIGILSISPPVFGSSYSRKGTGSSKNSYLYSSSSLRHESLPPHCKNHLNRHIRPSYLRMFYATAVLSLRFSLSVRPHYMSSVVNISPPILILSALALYSFTSLVISSIDSLTLFSRYSVAW